MLALRCIAPLTAVLVVACASESPRTYAPPPRDAAAPLAPSASPQGESVPPLAHAAPASDEPSADTLSARYARSPALSRFSGQASYYSDALAGRSTASGEPYRPRAFTAAHRSLPFGTIVRVTSDITRQSVYVRINDRGPFVRGRVLDLSRAAAEKLGLLSSGVVKVRAEVVENGPVKKRTRRRTRKRKSSH